MKFRVWIYIGVIVLFIAGQIVPIFSDFGIQIPGWVKVTVVLFFIADIFGNIVAGIDAFTKKKPSSDEMHSKSHGSDSSAKTSNDPNPPNKAPEPTTLAVTSRAPSSTSRASEGRGSS